MLQRTARLLIAIALLVAQQTALAHQIWHAGKQDSQPARGALCEQHAALATVAGAVDCASVDAAVVPSAEVEHRFVATRTSAAPRLAPTSRGPPETLF
jgi:hypothetical protein